MNKDYYEFVFVSDQSKLISLKITNAKEISDTSDFADAMDEIIGLNILSTSKGVPVAKKIVKYIRPSEINVTVLPDNKKIN